MYSDRRAWGTELRTGIGEFARYPLAGSIVAAMIAARIVADRWGTIEGLFARHRAYDNPVAARPSVPPAPNIVREYARP